jgi:hypothetical protein
MPTSGEDSAFPILPGVPGFDQTANAVGLTKREYFAVHLFEAAISKLSVNCTLQDKANYAVDAADALVRALQNPVRE